jgi:hypothetical protein
LTPGSGSTGSGDDDGGAVVVVVGLPLGFVGFVGFVGGAGEPTCSCCLTSDSHVGSG